MLAELDYDVREALAVTWGDQQAVSSFRVVANVTPAAEALELSVIELLERPVVAQAVPDRGSDRREASPITCRIGVRNPSVGANANDMHPR